MKLLGLSVAFLLTCCVLQACDQRGAETQPTPATQPPLPSTAKDSSVTGSTVTFMTEATINGLMEVQASQLAQKKTNDSKVREFATKMAKDHAEANQALHAIAAKKAVTLPPDLDGERQAKLQSLESASDAELDRTYVNQMVADHTQAVVLFEREVKDGQDAEVRAFAAERLAELRRHLDDARDMPQISKPDTTPR